MQWLEMVIFLESIAVLLCCLLFIGMYHKLSKGRWADTIQGRMMMMDKAAIAAILCASTLNTALGGYQGYWYILVATFALLLGSQIRSVYVLVKVQPKHSWNAPEKEAIDEGKHL